MIFSKCKKYLPAKSVIWNFIFNLTLLIVTLLVGNYYISTRIFDINQEKLEKQNFIEKQNEFINNFTKIGQSRIYLAERFYYDSINNEDTDTIQKSWNDYMKATIGWNKNNLLNPIFIKYYFGDNMQEEFYNNLLPKMVNMHNKLLEFRKGNKTNNIKNSIEKTKHELFIFSGKLISNSNKLYAK